MRGRGVVAAGAQGTAAIGAEMLRRGGHAVDAACAACFATSAFEPALTSLAGGGLLMVHDAAADRTSIVDFFSNAPGLGARAGAPLDFLPATVDFGSAQQVFHIGRAAAAVPGTLLGLAEAHARFGRLPLAELVAPTCEALRGGVSLDAFQAWTFELLDPILGHSTGSRASYKPDGRRLMEGDRFCNRALADTLETVAKEGIRSFYDHHLAPTLARDFGPAQGGRITTADLEAYRVITRAPLCRTYRGARLCLPPWPSQGGVLVAAMLGLLEAVDLRALERGTAPHLATLVAAMRTADAIKAEQRDPFTAEGLGPWRERFAALLEGAPATAGPPPHGPGSTTHVSVIDGEGNAATVTISYGEGCGYTLGDTGIVLNNFMGEDDLHPDGFHTAPPGERLVTNMCPTTLRVGDRFVALGTGGANRIRTAITQVISNIVDRDLPAIPAVAAGRLHVEGGVVNAEVFDLPDDRALEAVAAPDEEIVRFPEPNLFFGGVHLARRRDDGDMAGAGDPRRSGAVVVVE